MGKLSRKMAKHQQKNKEGVVNQEINSLKQQMIEQIKEEKYPEAIETMAGLAQCKCIDAEVMYQGAYAYFMIGDYERAGTWINNTLTYAPNHVAVRILLARLCLLEDRIEDGLAVFDFVVEHYVSSLTTAERTEMEEILEYYGRNEADKLQQHYPHIAKFLQLGNIILPEPEASPVVNEVAAAEETVFAVKADSTSDDSIARAQAAVAALKNLALKASETVQVDELKKKANTVVENIGTKAGQMAEALKDSVNEAAAPFSSGDTVAEQTKLIQKEILTKSVSLAEKIRLFNAFSGAAYVDDRLEDARQLLNAALELDAEDPATLRNMAVLMSAMGHYQQALEYVSRLPVTDFVLLDRLHQR